MKTVSIIIPVYNTSKYLVKCLDSVINQTYNNTEIIVVNDGSTDDSEQIIQQYKRNYDDKIKYFKTVNSGLSSTRNFGVSKASGDYLMFLDSDDYIEPTLFEKLIPYMEEDVDLIKYKLNIVDENYNTKESISGPVFSSISGQDGFNKLCFSDVFLDPAPLYLFNLNFYKENCFNFKEGTYHEDFGLIPLILVKAKSFVSTPIFGYYYVQISNSITRNNDYTRTVKQANDLLLHYDYMVDTITRFDLTLLTISNLKLYYTNAILNAIGKLKNPEKKLYKEEIKKRKLINNIKIKNFKQLIKKIYYRFLRGL